MSAKKVLVGAAAGAGASLVLFSGVASAAPAQEGDPTGDNQLCGMVSTSSGDGVANVVIHGTLNGVALPNSATTNSDGSYCVVADQTLADEVIDGGIVNLYATPPAGVTITSPNPWETLLGSPDIDQWVFLAHLDDTYTSAVGFNFTASN
ncbi:hypothetical protein [Tomitella gaofuii]|uniref:hypothetical protein n=1 Tax=Tomitella gaofuii TaxID=2760083 RepID=UPI0015F91766|nr:hypothetical protein [Tomitella gaofuii]